MSAEEKMDSGDTELIGCGVLFVLALIVVLLIMTFGTTTTMNATIVDRVVDNGNTMFVVQPDGSGQQEILTNVDAWLNGKTNSGDYLLSLKVGHHYRLTVNWVRFSPLSLFKNIIGFEETPSR